ncbi:MAG: hypothetical protein FWE00_11600 [Defluviitaleaceae bacterium]|nr:hypothetical protein [Defluviitaleaceae bacterium]
MRAIKALILSHDRDRGGVYVMDDGGSFRFVRGHLSQPAGTEIEIREVAFVNFRKIVAVAASFALILALGCFGWLWNSVSFYVYVDINPSVELQFNRLNRLKTAVPLNEDGAALLDSLRISGGVENIAASLIEAAEQRGFLEAGDGAPALFISIIPAGGRSPDAAVSAVNAALEKRGMLDYSVVETGDTDLRDRALELGVSPGRLMLAEALIYASGGQMTLESALNMSAGEKHAAIQGADNPGGPALPGNENETNASASQYSGNSPGAANPEENAPADAPPADAPPVSAPPVNDPPAVTPPANVIQGNNTQGGGRSDNDSSDDNRPVNNPPGGGGGGATPDPEPTVAAEVVGSGNGRYVRITVTYVRGEYTQEFRIEPGLGSETYVITTTNGRFTVYITFRDDEVYTAEILGYNSGGNTEPTVAAEVVGSGNGRYVRITVEHIHGRYTQEFVFDPGLDSETYVVETANGSFTVYITFRDDEVYMAEIIGYDSGGNTEPTVSAEVVEAGEEAGTLYVKITVTYVHGRYTQEFALEPSLDSETYVIETANGSFTVYITFHGNEVSTAEILGHYP